jgi:hypothetical protein
LGGAVLGHRTKHLAGEEKSHREYHELSRGLHPPAVTVTVTLCLLLQLGSWAELFFVLAFLLAKVLYLGLRRGAELLFSVLFLPPDCEPLEEGESGELRPGLFPFRQCFASFCFQDIPFLFRRAKRISISRSRSSSSCSRSQPFDATTSTSALVVQAKVNKPEMAMMGLMFRQFVSMSRLPMPSVA